MEALLTVNSKTVTVGIHFLEGIASCIPDSLEYQEIMHEIAKSQNSRTRELIALKDNLSEETTRLLLSDPEPSGLENILRSETAKIVLTDRDIDRIVELGFNGAVGNLISIQSDLEQVDPSYVPNALLFMKNDFFEYLLASYPGTPDYIKKKLANSNDPDISTAVKS